MLDVAHNPAASASLATTLNEQFPGKKFVAVVALMQDKDLDGVLHPFDTLIDHWFCPGLDVERALAPANAAAKLNLNYAPEQVSVCADVSSALDLVLESSEFPANPVLVFGSFFTVADALVYLNSP